MPIRPPALDDRTFDDLVEELVARIPAHTPEWTNPRLGDPGRTLIELFAWLGDALLYRVNLIPERQRLAFLRLVGAELRPAIPARAIVSVLQDGKPSRAVSIRARATIKGAAPFETRSELTVMPVTAEAYYKRPITDAERKTLGPVLDGLPKVYGLGTQPARYYATTPAFPGSAYDPAGFDLGLSTLDGCLWIALFAADAEHVPAAIEALGTGPEGQRPLLNVGISPAMTLADPLDALDPASPVAGRARIPHVFEMSTGREVQKRPEYVALDEDDHTNGLTEDGVVRLVMPAAKHIGAPTNDVRKQLEAGLGDRPPRIDDPKRAARLVTWLRLRLLTTVKGEPMPSLRLAWVGVNAVAIDQRRTVTGRVVGASEGTADQVLALGATSVERETLRIEVEEAGRGYVPWRLIEDLALAGRDDAVYALSSDEGTIRFGDGVRGRIPEAASRVRIAEMRAGGGRAGNLPPGSLKDVAATDRAGHIPGEKLVVAQSMPTSGGQDAETVREAEQRVPLLLRHRDRAVTADDYKVLAAFAPGTDVGRVEVLPRFKPQQRRDGVPGVVSVMALPSKPGWYPPNPRADRPFIERIHAYLDARRPLATELYVIGCEYVALGLGVAVTVRAGAERDQVLFAVRDALRRHLWSLAPGGAGGAGWPLGAAVRDRELEVVVAQVEGVGAVAPLQLFEAQGGAWTAIARSSACAPVELTLEAWQLPELLDVVVVEGDEAPLDLTPTGLTVDAGIAVPVVPEVC